jgi:membrane protease YdiL (CAAX protease family)
VKTDPGPGAAPPRHTLLLALLAPTLLGALGIHLLHSLSATFWLYLLAGCLLIPATLLRVWPLRSGPGGLPWQPRGRPRWRRAWLWLTLSFGPVFLVIYLAVRPALGSIDAYRDRVAGLGLDLDQPLLAAVAFVILNPLLEEWWWRGQATPRCVAAFGPRAGLALATFGFGLYHVVLLSGLFPLPVAVLRSLLIAAAGWLWSTIALQQQSWRDVYLAHLAADIAMVVLFALLVLPG